LKERPLLLYVVQSYSRIATHKCECTASTQVLSAKSEIKLYYYYLIIIIFKLSNNTKMYYTYIWPVRWLYCPHYWLIIQDRCYDHEFVIAPPIAYDHGCVPIGQRDQWRHGFTWLWSRRPSSRLPFSYDPNPKYWP